MSLYVSAGKRKKVSTHCALTYAAPEAVIAFEDDRQLVVHPSLDIWSLGVMVYVCVSGTEVFDEAEGLDAVSLHARGHATYPWEGPKMAEAWAKSPARPLLQPCLSRDPTQRPSASELLHAIDKFVKANIRKSFMV